MAAILQKFFGFDPKRHNVRTEITAGVTTFLTMAYILAVNPSIFGALGDQMPGGAVFTATALSAIVATLVMAIYAKKPLALAPGMGLNAFFVYTVCLTMGYDWKFALTAVFIEGILFIILSLLKIRSLIVNAIPAALKNSIGAGIGLFIAFIGLQNAGIIVNSDSTLVTLGDITSGSGLLAMIGIFITAALVVLKVKGGILLGILATSLLGLVIKDPVTGMALTSFNGVVSMPAGIGPIFCKFEWSQVFSLDMLVVVMTFLFIDIFDTMGTVIGVSYKAEMVKEDGEIDGINKVFLADSIGTLCGAMFGTSTVTTYVESSSGVSEGGRTGLTAFSTVVCLALALFFSPLFLAIPSAATAPALIVVGMMMMEPVMGVDWDNYLDAIPAFLTIILMPVAYSISEGILIGVIAYVLINALTGNFKRISPTMWVLGVIFILRYIFI